MASPRMVLAFAAAQQGKGMRRAPAGGCIPMAKILIVDDDAMTVEMLSMALNLFGHTPLRAYRSEEALHEAAAHRPDLILLDLMMPGVDGYQTLRRLRALPETRRSPILVVTASAEADVEERVTLAGANGCLHKPIDLDVLEKEIERVLLSMASAGTEAA